MAFPGKFDISYYRGDTYEFRIYPKNTAGESYNLSSFTTATFTISTARGNPGIADKRIAYADISDDGTYITCAIRPTDGAALTGGSKYVYDVEVSKTGTPYDTTITLVTGNIFMTEQVTGAV